MAESDSVLSGLVRIGTVTDVNTSDREARVKFEDVDMTSGWLPVLQHYNTDMSTSVTVSSYTDPDTGRTHTHTVTVTTKHEYWMPKVNDVVVTVYQPIWNADGFILGAI